MAQVTIYLPDNLATAAKQRAQRARKSVSAWIAEVLEREVGKREWPPSFVELLTRGPGGDLVEPEDPPPQKRERLR